MDPEHITHVAGLPFLSEDAEFDQCVQFASGGGFAEGDPFADFLEAEAPCLLCLHREFARVLFHVVETILL